MEKISVTSLTLDNFSIRSSTSMGNGKPEF